MTHKEMSEIFAVMLLAYPNAEVFKGGIAKLGPTINLWVTCLPEIDFWTGQQAVVEVVFNRVLHSAFPDSVHDVLHQGEDGDVPQFSTIYAVSTATPTQAQYDAINGALYGDTILDADVVFFSRNGENDRVWGQIGDHIFCREYIWR